MNGDARARQKTSKRARFNAQYFTVKGRFNAKYFSILQKKATEPGLMSSTSVFHRKQAAELGISSVSDILVDKYSTYLKEVRKPGISIVIQFLEFWII